MSPQFTDLFHEFLQPFFRDRGEVTLVRKVDRTQVSVSVHRGLNIRMTQDSLSKSYTSIHHQVRTADVS